MVTGDGDPDAVAALTRYYTEAGTPPGRWLGAGLGGLAHTLAAGEAVSEQHLRRLMGEGLDPTTGLPLGRRYRHYASTADRIARRLDALPEELSPHERTAQDSFR